MLMPVSQCCHFRAYRESTAQEPNPPINNIATTHSAFTFLLQSIKINLEIVIQNLAAPQSALRLVETKFCSSLLRGFQEPKDQQDCNLPQLSDSKCLVRRQTWQTTTPTGVRAPTDVSNFRCENGAISFAEMCFYVSKLMVLPLLKTVSVPTSHVSDTGAWACWLSIQELNSAEKRDTWKLWFLYTFCIHE